MRHFLTLKRSYILIRREYYIKFLFNIDGDGITIRGKDLDETELGCTSSKMTSPSALKNSRNWFVFCDLPNFVSKPLPGAAALLTDDL